MTTNGQKTYHHLIAARRVPTAYEIVTSRLLYYVERGGLAVATPVGDWIRRHQTESPLAGAAWEDFADPRATTYAEYVALQRDAEQHVDRLLGPLETSGYDAALPAAWLDALARTLPPLRFAFHGLQMAAAYVGQLAPGGRIVVAAAFQAADELRRIHGLAHRVAQLARTRPDLATASAGRAAWQTDPAWQPLRRVIETLLVTYDWGEALVALNVCVKPLVDALFLDQAARVAEEQRDYVDAQILRSYADDATWQRAWTERLLRIAVAASPARAAAVARWITTWCPRAEQGVAEAAPLLGPTGRAALDRARVDAVAFAGRISEGVRDVW